MVNNSPRNGENCSAKNHDNNKNNVFGIEPETTTFHFNSFSFYKKNTKNDE